VRIALKKINDQRTRFRGTYERAGSKANWHGYSTETILLKNIIDEEGNVLTDHLWFNYTKSFEDLGALQRGDVIEFEARVTRYTKGYVNRRAKINDQKSDFKLSRPTKVRRVISQ